MLINSDSYLFFFFFPGLHCSCVPPRPLVVAYIYL